jgi:hypothetical protein
MALAAMASVVALAAEVTAQPVTYVHCSATEDGGVHATSKFTVAQIESLAPEVATACDRHIVFVLVRCRPQAFRVCVC